MSESHTVTATTDSGPLNSEKEIHINTENVALVEFRRGEATGLGLALAFGVPVLVWYMIDSAIGFAAGPIAFITFISMLALVIDLGNTQVITKAETIDFDGNSEALEELEQALQSYRGFVSISKSRDWPHKELTYRIHINRGEVSTVSEADKLTLPDLVVYGTLGIGLIANWVYTANSIISGALVSGLVGVIVGVLGIVILIAFKYVYPTPRRVEVTLSNGQTKFLDLHPNDAKRVVSQLGG